eukprot:scaffold228091_cov48-Prasinocladus_malaysianus.AAC.3
MKIGTHALPGILVQRTAQRRETNASSMDLTLSQVSFGHQVLFITVLQQILVGPAASFGQRYYPEAALSYS